MFQNSGSFFGGGGLFVVGYYVLLEGYLGQTLGKMATGIKVVSEATGATPGVAAAAVRTVLRLVDGLFSYLVAFIVVLASGKRQRFHAGPSSSNRNRGTDIPSTDTDSRNMALGLTHSSPAP